MTNTLTQPVNRHSLTFRLICRGCGLNWQSREWLPTPICDVCLTTKGATDPHHIVGFWHGCLGSPDHSIKADSYWAGYAKALRKIHRRRETSGLIELLREFPGIDAAEALQKYGAQRLAALSRGIEWRFDARSWLRVWVESGRWAERGNGKYVMARHGDIGPYSPGNVYIATSSQNIKDGWINKPVRRHRPIGIGKGWTRRGAKSYVVRVQGKHIGTFPTQEDAESAYRDACFLRRSTLEAQKCPV